MSRRATRIWILLIVFSTGSAGYAWFASSQAQSRATDAKHRLHDASLLIDRILSARQDPAVVEVEVRAVTMVSSQIEAAAKAAGLSADALQRVWPQAPRQIAETAYERRGTQVVVRDASLPQAVAFLHQLTTGVQPLHLDEIRLSAPRSSDDAHPERWNLEASVSYLLYQPSPDLRTSRRSGQ